MRGQRGGISPCRARGRGERGAGTALREAGVLACLASAGDGMPHEYHWTLVVRTSKRLSSPQRDLIESGALGPLVAGLRASGPPVLDAEVVLMDERDVP